MVWQKLVSHVNGDTVEVESARGDKYTVITETDRLNDKIYSQLINEAHDNTEFWAWVEFNDEPVVRDMARGDMPTKPPWEY